MDVLVDLSPLETASRFHGIGSYARYLGMALAALEERERRNLEIDALWRLSGERAKAPLVYESEESPKYPSNSRWLVRRRTELVATLHRLRPRLFHMTQPFGAPRGSFVPRVVTCHDILPLVLEHEYRPGPWIARRFEGALDALRYHGARRVIAISEHTANDLIRILRVPARIIDVIPHGVDRERFHPAKTPAEEERGAAARRRLGVDEAPYFLFLGAADPRKNAPLLVSAFAKAALDGAKLVFAGRVPPRQRAPVDAAIAEAGIARDVKMLGFVEEEDLLPLIHGALALVYPSRYEGFGLPVLEAMAAGCPVITTHATSLREVAGDAAVIVPADDVSALSDALRSVALDASLRDEMRAKGFPHAARFSWKNTALATVDTYVRALA